VDRHRHAAEEVVAREAAALARVVNLGCIDLNPHPVRADDLDHSDELRVYLERLPGVDRRQIVYVAVIARDVLTDDCLGGSQKTSGYPRMSGSCRINTYAQIEPRCAHRDSPRED
jgi:bifunctional non-homologous end joining protein LigD